VPWGVLGGVKGCVKGCVKGWGGVRQRVVSGDAVSQRRQGQQERAAGSADAITNTPAAPACTRIASMARSTSAPSQDCASHACTCTCTSVSRARALCDTLSSPQ
jgi:hypothetical protein